MRLPGLVGRRSLPWLDPARRIRPRVGSPGLAGAEGSHLQGLYRAASAKWTEAGCEVHAITLLANDDEAQNAWFWNGFGLAVVDAVRSTAALDTLRLTAHRAACNRSRRRDAEQARRRACQALHDRAGVHGSAGRGVARLFRSSSSRGARTASGWHLTRRRPRATGMRVLCVSPATTSTPSPRSNPTPPPSVMGRTCEGPCRGRGAGRAMLQAALTHYASMGLDGVYTNFEAFNPEAAVSGRVTSARCAIL